MVKTCYVVIRVTSEVSDENLSDESVCSRIAEESDYEVALEDDLVKIVDTEMLDVSSNCPL